MLLLSTVRSQSNVSITDHGENAELSLALLDVKLATRCNVKQAGSVHADLLSTSLNPFPRIAIVNAAADLQPIRPRSTGFCRRVVVSRSKHDDMCSDEIIVAVQFPIIPCRQLGDIICLEIRIGGRQCSSHDLLHAACVQVYAGSESCHCEWSGLLRRQDTGIWTGDGNRIHII